MSYLKIHPDIVLYLFGSRARGDAGSRSGAGSRSDVDLGLLSSTKVEARIVLDLKKIAEKSNIPYVVDLSTVSKAFRESAMKEAIVWKND